jgi:hypothetical protein
MPILILSRRRHDPDDQVHQAILGVLLDVSDDLVAAAVVIVTDRLPFVGFLSGSHQVDRRIQRSQARPIIAGTNAETVTRVPAKCWTSEPDRPTA